MSTSSREENIVKLIEDIEQSPLSVKEYLQRNEVPFSKAQFYRHRARLAREGKDGLVDKRRWGNHRKLDKEQITFIRGFIKNRPEVGLTQVQEMIEKEFGIKVHCSTMSRILKKLDFHVERKHKEVKKKEQVSCAGFELVAALAVHVGWHEHTAECIQQVVDSKCQEQQPSGRPEKKGRNAKGQFTKQYNQREEIRRMRFAAIAQKRAKKNLRRMNICKRSAKNLERKSLAVLALPLVTLNGQMRNVNTAMGNALKGFCGYNYKQATLDRFLQELKYLGVAETLLCGQIPFWQKSSRATPRVLPALKSSFFFAHERPTHSHQTPGFRLSRDRSVRPGHRRDRQALGRPRLGPDSAADAHR